MVDKREQSQLVAIGYHTCAALRQKFVLNSIMSTHTFVR
jgi:hypothetical protein